jgi:pimeloyl-ACP methyl ester carboxylesterase
MRSIGARVRMAVAACALLAGCAQIERPGPLASRDVRSGYFFSGGEYVGTGAGRHMSGQMYVEYRIPEKVRRPYPIVMIHGGGQTGANFVGTPDDRLGWADWFAAQGWAVYVVDQPARGRSAYHADTLGRDTVRSSPERVRDLFTRGAGHDLWPTSRLHDQWPAGSARGGAEGDPVFDQFYASQVPWTGHVRSEEMVRAAGAALLDRIGPAILITHSQSGPYGWQIADARPGKVKAILSIEPNGPPFFDIDYVGAPDWYKVLRPARVFGLTWTAITFAPALARPEDLRVVEEATPAFPGAIRCKLQAPDAPRTLPTLAAIPVAIVTGEASFRAGVDHCTAAFLRQAGVDAEQIRLAQLGVRGNGHMMMLEKNSHDVARVLQDWLQRRVR